MERRHALIVLGAATLGLVAPNAVAQTYPNRPLRLLVGFPPGAQTDLVARFVAAKLGEQLGQSIVVENRSGASGTIAAEAASRAPADGYTLLIGGNANLVLASLVFDNLRYDPLRDFVPIGRVARVPLIIAVNASVPANTYSELLDLARAKPGTLTCATGSVGNQIVIEYLMSLNGTRIVNIPYKGTAPAVTDVVAGRVDLIIADFAAVAPHARAGAIRMLASTGAARGRESSSVPTLAELGVRGFAYYSWSAVMAPSGTPAESVDTLRKALRRAMQAPDFNEAIERMGYDAMDEDPEGLLAHVRSEIDRYRPIVKAAGITGATP